ncbi:MAG: hypothetical protein LBF12_01675, partial [Christensenellaceae bacterium]|nr:hypothetical protein [Christensenellaceae bacterium]
MYIRENKGINPNKIYCYASECNWNSLTKRYEKPTQLIGQLDSSQSQLFMPNDYMSRLLIEYRKEECLLNNKEHLIVQTVLKRYGESVFDRIVQPHEPVGIQTAQISSIGPSIVFGSITKKYELDIKLKKAFGSDIANSILALSSFLVCEGAALSNAATW